MRSRCIHGLAAALCLCAVAAFAAPADDNPPDSPAGVGVLARGPVHEAFAAPADVRPEAGPIVPQKPPDPVAETPPDQKPEGDDVAWIPGYWAWDDGTSTFLWVSGFWRSPPPGRNWTPGNWQQVDGGWQWSPGYWGAQDAREVEYLPPPPASIDEGPSVPAPDEDSVYVPGCWVYHETHFLWRPGYWVAFQPEWVWIPDHYCRTPAGCIFVAGYWDHPLESRGLLFAPVRFDAALIGRADFTYVPEYVVSPDFLLTALFARPAYNHYYFGDYFEDRYEREGFTPWIDYRVGKHSADPNFAFYQHRFRQEKGWDAGLRSLYASRRSGDAPRPPQTWSQQRQLAGKFAANRTGNAAISDKINLTNLDAVTALAHVSRAVDLRVTGLSSISGPRSREGKAPPIAPAIKLEPLSKDRRAEVDRAVKETRDFTATRQREQARMVSEGAPTKPTDAPKAVKVQPPTLPARPQETRPQTKPPAPPPPPPPAPKHEERPLPPAETPKPPTPPKNPPPAPKEPPVPLPPREPTPPKTPPQPPPTPPKEPPTPPKTPPPAPKEPPVPLPPREPPPPKEPPQPPPAPPKEPPTSPPPRQEPPPAPPKEPPSPPPAPPPSAPPHQPPTPPPAPPHQPPPPPAQPPKEPPHKDKPPAVLIGA